MKYLNLVLITIRGKRYKVKSIINIMIQTRTCGATMGRGDLNTM